MLVRDQAPDPTGFFPMKLLVDRITEEASEHAFEPSPTWWEEATRAIGELEGADRESFSLVLRAHRMGEDLYLEGRVEGRVELGCSRCLARYFHPLHEDFRLVLEPAGERPPAEPEAVRALAEHGLALADELEAGWYRGPEVELDGFLREVLALALPVQPLCREDCRGLCPRCGADRNLAVCGCQETKPDSPFAVLEVLRGGLDGGRH
jgi:uncharacterized protein